MDLGLGIAGLTFTIFTACVSGFKFLSTATNLGKDAELLVCLLRLEEYRLLLWGRQSGLADDNLDPRLNESVVNTILSELRRLLSDTERLRKRYKIDVRDEDPASTQDVVSSTNAAGLSPSALGFLDNEAIRKEEEMLFVRARRVKEANLPHKKFWWAFVDRAGFEELLGHIGRLVQRLFDLLTVNAREDTEKSMHMAQLCLISLTEKMEDLRLVTNDIKRAVVPDEALETTAALRRLQIELSGGQDGLNGPTAPRAPLAYKRLLKTTRVDGHASSAAHGLYEGAPVYIERKRYSAADVSGSHLVRLKERVENLSRLLHAPKAPSFHALHCVGYFHDPIGSEFVFLFDRPPIPGTSSAAQSSSSPPPPVALSALLRSKEIPSLDLRRRLARDLATTLLHLHASGWLHKGLNPDNILFFPASTGGSSAATGAMAEPWIMGYEYARQDLPGELSDKPSQSPGRDVYRHPRAQGPVSASFVRAFDVYALGILLVEIAYWRPWPRLLAEKLGAPTARGASSSSSHLQVTPVGMEEARKRVLDEGSRDADAIPQNLRFRMGEGYAKATMQCFGDFFEGDEISNKEYLSTLYDLVVRRL